MKDWAGFMLQTEKHLREVNRLLIDHPAAAPFNQAQREEINNHLYQAIHGLTQVHAWIHDRR
jgi:hypothetical protein